MGMRMYVCVGRLDEWIGGYFKYSDDSIYALLRDNGCDVRDFTGAYNSWVWKVSITTTASIPTRNACSY